MRLPNIAAILIACLAGLLPNGSAMAFPPLPSSFYGTVTYNSQDVPDGTVIQALIDGQVYAEAYTMTYEGKSVYALDVLGDDSSTVIREGGRESEPIQFKIGGIAADQTATWHSGVNAKLDLSAVSSNPLATPQTTSTQPPTQTSIVQPSATAVPASATHVGGQASPTIRPAALSANNATEYSNQTPPGGTSMVPRSPSPEDSAATPIVVTQPPVSGPRQPTLETQAVPGPAATAAPAQAGEPAKSSSITIWLGAWLGLLLMAGAAWFFLRKR